MSNFFKHVGECNGKKVIIVQRSIPGEDHMAAVIYSDIIPSRFHDDLMKVLESPEGQASREFMDVMHRRFLSNGENMLVSLVNEGYVKKAQANQVIVKPNAKSSIRLDELTKLLKAAGEGADAQRRLEELDRQRGLSDPIKKNAPMPAFNDTVQNNSVLDDDALAINYRNQAARMRAEAKSLLAESERLENEANSLAPVKVEPVAKETKARGRRSSKATA